MAFQERLKVRSTRRWELLDLTDTVRAVVLQSGVKAGICHVYVTGATAAVVINENDDPQLIDDFLEAMDQLVPEGRWRHDRIDDNGAAHIKSALLGPGESIPIADGDLALGRWQNIFLCEFDGPRTNREVVVTLVGE